MNTFAPIGSLYEQDFYAWSNQQAALLRAGKLAQADIENIAEEIESMGRSEKKELVSRLRILLLYLLKWQFQPKGRTSSWSSSIKIQRLDLQQHLKDNPSLKIKLPEAVEIAFAGAVIEAAEETKVPDCAFPTSCQYSWQQMIAADFWPD